MSPPDPRANVEDVHELSPLQQGFLFHHLRDAAGGDYIEQMTFLLEGALDVAAFGRAWQAVADRHAALRTSFQWEGLEQPLQVVHRRVTVPVATLDWSADDAGTQAVRLSAWLAEDRARGFAPAQAPLLRLTVIALGGARTQVVWTHSHLLMDGWSLPIVLRDVLAAYAAAVSGRAAQPQTAAPRYRDFVKWLRTRDARAAETFWRRELAGFDEPTPLPVRVEAGDRDREDTPCEVSAGFGAEETARLKTWSAARGVTLATLTTAAWALVLARMSGRDEVVFGCTVAGRPPELARAEETVGLFINTLPLRVAVPAVATAGAWLAAVQARLAAARTYEHTPLANVRGWSEVPAGRGLFETLFVFENYPGAGAAAEALPAGLRLAEARSLERTHYPLTVVAAADVSGLAVRLLCDGVRVTKAAGEDISVRFRAAVRQLTAGEGVTRLGVIRLLEPAELTQLAAWSGAARKAETPDWLGLFLSKAARQPTAPALISAAGEMSYAALAAQTAGIAQRLRAAGAVREKIVALCFGRATDWPVAALAVVRAGAAYLPIDPAYPAARIEFMLADSGAALVIAPREHAERVRGEGRTVLIWEELNAKEGAAEKVEANAVVEDVEAAQAAYVIYTSGSTGRPKGVVVSRGAWAALAAFQAEAAGLGAGDRVLQFASTSFDASVWELSLALSSGAALVCATAEALRPGEPLAETLATFGVTCVLLPPSTAAHLPEGAGATLRLLIVGGEACRPGLVERWADGTRRFVNAYGPTENAVVATWTELRADETHAPIGGPVTGTRAQVLDTAGGLVPPGVAGELCIAGASLARGYLGRPELTAERFMPDPFSREPGARLYRTGDLVRWAEDGRLEFLGRIDEQVKVRGFRIELGEIEAVLTAHPAVREAAVAVRDVTQLAAWIALREGATASAAELRTWARERLPEHMVPGGWVFVAALPLTPNGKVNKKALPAVDAEGDAGLPSDCALDGSPLTAVVAGTFAEVLGLGRVGADGNFFELGGHSLLATKLISRLRERVAPGLALRAIFDAPTPRGLAEWVSAQRAGGAGTPPPLTARDGTGPAPASFGQQRFWLLERLTPGNAANHLQLAVRLRGPLVAERLAAALVALTARHEPLRTGLREEAGAVMQTEATGAPVTLAVTESGDWKTLLAADAATAFDLGSGPLWRVRLVRVGADEHVLGFTFHHAIFDGWSEGVLVRELGALYEGRVLPALALSYGDFAAWQRAWLRGGELARQLDYWRTKLAGVPVLELPTDRARPPVQTYVGGMVAVTLDAAVLGALTTQARNAGATLFMVLLAGWETWLLRHSGQTDFAVGTPIAGRTRREAEPLIGLFLNTLVLRADTAGDPLFTELLARVRTTTLDAYAHQDAPFEQIVEALNPPRDLARPPLFQTLLVLQNSPVGEARVAGLTLEPLHAEGRTAKYELTLGASERDGGLGLSLEFNTALFDRATAERLLARYVTLLAGAAAQPKRRLSALPLLSVAETAELRGWNDTARVWPAGPWIHEWPARISAETTALVFGEGKVSYGEFGARVTRLASVLRARGVAAETRVGVYLERSVELVVALHAVMKAGGVYVPLDPGYPAERVAHMLADAAAAWVITTGALAGQLPATPAEIFLIDAETEGDAAVTAATVPALHADSAAYMIYTSGSTGRPKGAVNTHSAILNRLLWMQAALPLTPADRVLQKTPFSFDVSVWEFFWPFMAGATLVVAAPDAHRDPARLVELIVAEKITTLHFVPSMLRAFLDAPGVERCTSLRLVVCSGEELPRELADRFYTRLNCALHNLYGPTEAAVDVTWHAVRRGDTGPVPIGRPIANIEIHVLDAGLREVPIGVAGEVFLGGVGLGRGYHARPELTAERWVPHPTVAGARLYRTGDLGRWRADGEVEYLGRLDFQVKLRGFRIELGEIEAVVRAQAGVADAVVTLRTDAPGDARLVGYVVARGVAPTVAELRAALAAQLPEHMVPAAWVFMDALPLSPAGKTDRRALPAPMAVVGASDAAPPQGPLEELVAALWAELLGGVKVGRDDNFFMLGGHSLLATQLVSRFREQVLVELPLMRFFEDPTPAGCARALVALEPMGGHAERYARVRLRMRALSSEEKARMLATTKP